MNGAAPSLAPGTIADLEGVMEVMRDGFDPRFGEAWTAAQCAGLLPMPGVWLTVARDGADTIGFALSRIVADEAELLLLAVRRSCQRRGIGSLLLSRFARDARSRGASRLHLEVREGNHAVNMYLQAGYLLVGRRPNYYKGPEGNAYDALTLATNVARAE